MRLRETFRSIWQFSLVGLAIWLTMAYPPGTLAQSAQPFTKSFDFRNGDLGWQAGFSDYPPATNQNDSYELRAEIKNLPPELGVSGTGYYIQGDNHSDDLFMFLKRQLDRNDGIVAGQTYQITFTIVLASNAQSGCSGIGGSRGEGVALKAGGSPAEPKALLTYRSAGFSQLVLNVDKSNQSQSGIAASVTGNIANGQPCNPSQASYVSIQRIHQHTSLVNANSRGELWLLVGTDSGFEGLTALYYQRIDVSLVPVNQQPPVLLSYLNGRFEHTGKATALESVSLMSEPFAVTSPQNFFSTDRHTRLTLFGYNLELRDGESPAVITVEGVDSQNRTYALPVEAVREVPDFNWITQVTVRLTEELQGLSDLSLAVKLRSVKSNQLPTAIR